MGAGRVGEEHQVPVLAVADAEDPVVGMPIRGGRGSGKGVERLHDRGGGGHDVVCSSRWITEAGDFDGASSKRWQRSRSITLLPFAHPRTWLPPSLWPGVHLPYLTVRSFPIVSDEDSLSEQDPTTCVAGVW